MTEKNMIRTGTRVFADKTLWGHTVGLWFVHHAAPRYMPSLITNIEWTEQEEGCQMPSTPSMEIPIEEAQQLYDSLHKMGFRPSDNEPSTHIERHLKDMRQIAFNALEMNLPERED